MGLNSPETTTDRNVGGAAEQGDGPGETGLRNHRRQR
jgi:hypothetical protein